MMQRYEPIADVVSEGANRGLAIEICGLLTVRRSEC
jgi:hypothetical protein